MKLKWNLLENEILLTGCRYRSHINMHRYSYWLLDRKRKIRVESNHIKIENNVFQFPDLKITSFNMIGNYECVIENENVRGQKIVSSKALFSDLKGELESFTSVLNSEIFLVEYKTDIRANGYKLEKLKTLKPSTPFKESHSLGS